MWNFAFVTPVKGKSYCIIKYENRLKFNMKIYNIIIQKKEHRGGQDRVGSKNIDHLT